MLFIFLILLKFQIDDPLDAIPVHGGGGIWGTLAVYLFKWDGILMSWTSEAAKGLGWNIIGLLAIVSWTGINCFFMFFTLKKMGQLRVEPEQEFKGGYRIKPNLPNWKKNPGWVNWVHSLLVMVRVLPPNPGFEFGSGQNF